MSAKCRCDGFNYFGKCGEDGEDSDNADGITLYE